MWTMEEVEIEDCGIKMTVKKQGAFINFKIESKEESLEVLADLSDMEEIGDLIVSKLSDHGLTL